MSDPTTEYLAKPAFRVRSQGLEPDQANSAKPCKDSTPSGFSRACNELALLVDFDGQKLSDYNLSAMAERDESFWGLNSYNHPPLTDEVLALAEGSLGVKLPAEYVELLRIQNGGYTAGFAFPTSVKTTWADDHVPLEDLNGIVAGVDVSSAMNLMDNEYMCEEWKLPPMQVLISGDGHTWISLDYRKGVIPSVAWIDVECDEELQLASTFAEFIEKLVPASVFEPEDEYTSHFRQKS